VVTVRLILRVVCVCLSVCVTHVVSKRRNWSSWFSVWGLITTEYSYFVDSVRIRGHGKENSLGFPGDRALKREFSSLTTPRSLLWTIADLLLSVHIGPKFTYHLNISTFCTEALQVATRQSASWHPFVVSEAYLVHHITSGLYFSWDTETVLSLVCKRTLTKNRMISMMLF